MIDHAPDFPPHAEWLNTTYPLSLEAELCGQVVLIVFWSASCIHSTHVLQSVDELLPRFEGRPFAAVAVHTPRNDAESDTGFVGRAIDKAGLKIPVLVDNDAATWDAYGCTAWPTIAVLDSGSCLRFVGAGEADAERLGEAIEALVDEAEQDGHFGSGVLHDPMPLDDGRSLAFPTKLAFDPESGLLWIADTGHHRLLAVDPESGVIQATVGNGVQGCADGEFDGVEFSSPRGLLVHDGMVYVADSGNHSIRSVDIRRGYVTRILGHGFLQHDRAGGRCGRAQGILSPWDLAWHDDGMLVAVAGEHQIWKVDPYDQHGVAFAGAGSRGSDDGVAQDATMAQPMGVASDFENAVFVDADGGALRRLDGDRVETLVQGAPLSHPRGVTLVDGEVWVVDAHADLLGRFDPDSGTIEPLDTGDLQLAAPEGLAVWGDRIYVADTDNHRIVVVPKGGGESTELEIREEPGESVDEET